MWRDNPYALAALPYLNDVTVDVLAGFRQRRDVVSTLDDARRANHMTRPVQLV